MAGFANGFRDRKVKANGIQLRVVTGTDERKPPLLLQHGIYDRAESWLPVVDQLAQTYWLIMPDLRGHNRSDWPDDGYSFADYATDAVGLLDALNVERAFVLGHSLGALISMVLTAQSPDRVKALVLEDPPSERSNETRTWIGALLSAKRGTKEESYIALQGIYPQRTEEDWRRQTDWLRETADGPFLALAERSEEEPESFAEAITKITCPTLLLQADPRHGAALSTQAARDAATQERCTLVKFSETGHSIHRERPEKFVEAVTAFLREN